MSSKVTSAARNVPFSVRFFVKNEDGSFERFTENFKEIAFSDEEITDAVENAGFKVVKRYEEFSCGQPKEDTQRAYYVIRREYNG